MCGIAGIISTRQPDSITRMTDVIHHRGPDESGYYHDDHISLGFKRLSIVDLNGGQQPISNESETLYLICNGEIYNSPELKQKLIQAGHTFKTSTDVEVILHLFEDYGRQCVRYLRGMFAFSIWDKLKKTLFLARDHMGQKPLYFYHKDHDFVFASEAKSILASGFVEPRIDMDGLWHYVSLRFIPDHYSLFKEIQKLPAATSLYYERGKVIFERYWKPDFIHKLPNNEDEIEEGLNSLLVETVQQHMMSDVQIGAFLSGGIDSSTVTAIMAGLTGEKLPAFSIGVQEQIFNELPYVKMVAEKYRLESYARVVNADLIHLLPTMIYHMDEPSDPFGVGVYLVSEIASKRVKVVMGGDGGDENFAGYDRFAGNRLVDYYCLFPQWFRKNIVSKIIKRIPESYGYKSVAQKAAWLNEMSFFSGGGERYAQSMSFLRFTQQAKNQLFTDKAKQQVEDYDSLGKIMRFFNSSNVNDLVDRMLYTDLMTRMPDHLLAVSDRMTMAHSLECRSPLIDYKVVEYAASIPVELKLKGNNLKYILKKVAARYLPDALINRRKQGFGFPIGIWMRTDMKQFILRLFRQSRFIDLGIFNKSYVNSLIEEHMSGKVDHNFRLWILINLEIWYRMYFENESIDSLNENISTLCE